MKAKLLKQLRKIIKDNSDIVLYSRWGGFMITMFDGIEYVSSPMSTYKLFNHYDYVIKELEQMAFVDYINRERNKRNF